MIVRNVTTVAALAALAALGVALYQRHRRVAAESAANAASHRAEFAAAELRRLAARGLEFRRALANSPRGAVLAPAADPAPAADDPVVIRRAVVRAHAAAALRYRPLFLSLHLLPETERKLAGIVEDYELKARDLWEEGEAEGISTADPALWQLMRPDYEKMKADVTALLGEAGFEQVDDYNRSLVAHDFSSTLVSSLYFTDSPLSSQQASALVPAVASLSPSYQQGHAALDLYTKDWSDSYSQLAGILAPAQLSALQTVVNARQAYVKLSPLVGASVGYVVNAAAQNPAPAKR